MNEKQHKPAHHETNRHEEVRQEIRHSAETPVNSPENHQKKHEELTKIRHEVERQSVEARHSKPRAEKQPTHEVHHHHLTKKIKQRKYEETLQTTRTQLKPREQRFSKFIHQPTIETISEVGAAVTRPSGIIGGSLAALIVGLGVLIIAKRIGFEVPGSLFAVLFLIGFVVGICIEFLTSFFRKKQSN
jgi:hypothetical protein